MNLASHFSPLTPHSTMPPFFRCTYALLFAALPWSVGLRIGSAELDFPAEPLMAVLGVGLAVYAARYSRFFLQKLRSAGLPLLLSAVWLGWMAWCAAWSSMPLVSWKYWLVEAGHWWVFAVGIALWPMLWGLLVRVFSVSMGGVVLYALAHHALHGFRADQALLAPMPFFEENTVYAAAVVFALTGWTGWDGIDRILKVPAVVGVPANDTLDGLSSMGAILRRLLLAALLLTGLWFSHCRAAQISAVVAVLVAALLLTWQRHRRSWLLLVAALCAVGLFFRGEIWGKTHEALARDVSALERLNRWHCALRMADERPLTGFGPGTFQFQYLRFQQSAQMTRISATTPVTERSPHTYGRGGGTHSEWLRPLAETGWPGLGFVIALFVIVSFVIVSFVIFTRRSPPRRAKEGSHPARQPLSVLLVLLVFIVHGSANDLLHEVCVAAWVWSAVGMSNVQQEMSNVQVSAESIFRSERMG